MLETFQLRLTHLIDADPKLASDLLTRIRYGYTLVLGLDQRGEKGATNLFGGQIDGV